MLNTELRIGNLIMKDDATFIICGISQKYVSYEHSGELTFNFRLEEVNPIPLTKEWLLGLGFIRNDNTVVSDSFYFIPVGGSELHINPDNGVVWIYRDGKSLFNNPACVDYVHQLQNLYFALTGIELTIKEEIPC